MKTIKISLLHVLGYQKIRDIIAQEARKLLDDNYSFVGIDYYRGKFHVYFRVEYVFGIELPAEVLLERSEAVNFLIDEAKKLGGIEGFHHVDILVNNSYFEVVFDSRFTVKIGDLLEDNILRTEILRVARMETGDYESEFLNSMINGNVIDVNFRQSHFKIRIDRMFTWYHFRHTIKEKLGIKHDNFTTIYVNSVIKVQINA